MIGAKKRFYILQRDGYRCRYCGKNGRDVSLEVDHIIPKALGGSDFLENLQCICRECNIGKGTTDVRKGLVEGYKIKMDDVMKRLKNSLYNKLNKNNIGTIENKNKILIHRFCELEIKGYKFNAHRSFLSGRYLFEEGETEDDSIKLFEEGGEFCDKILKIMEEDAECSFDSIIELSTEEGYGYEFFSGLKENCDCSYYCALIFK